MTTGIKLLRFAYDRGIERELAKARGVLEELDHGADRIVSAAKGFAPVRTGRYRSSIASHREDGKAVAVASAPYSAYVEWGTSRPTPAEHPLAKAIEVVSATS